MLQRGTLFKHAAGLAAGMSAALAQSCVFFHTGCQPMGCGDSTNHRHDSAGRQAILSDHAAIQGGRGCAVRFFDP